MSEFDKENEDVFQIVHDNPRRRGVIQDVGFIVPQQEAMEYAAIKAAQKRRGGDWQNVGFILLAAAAVIVAAVSALAR